MAFLGREREERVGRLARYVLKQQTSEGGWANYPGGPADLSTDRQGVLCPQVAGHDPRADYMVKARNLIRERGAP